MLMKVILIAVMALHGLIHLMGFAKAFNLAPMSQLTQPITRFGGGLWLLATALFLFALGFYISGKDSWWIVATAAMVLSQILIIRQWSDARFGTAGNIIILVPVIFAFLNALPGSYYNWYESYVKQRLAVPAKARILSDSSLQNLPATVAKYLRYSGVVGKPVINNFRAVFSGRMKTSLESSWMDIASRQYNFYDDDRARVFYVSSTLYGMPFEGLHRYTGNAATMKIKVASLVEVVDAKGKEMNQGETVTMLNDMCILAPATLISNDIRWETIDSLTVRATFTNRGNTISAVLHFNQKGELVNFVSGDRYLSSDGRTYYLYPWSTPIRDYKDFDGRRVPTYGEAMWFTPDGPFTYANFYITDIEYNNLIFK